MKLDLPLMVIALILAAFLQEILPPLPFGAIRLKVQLLPLVALYYLRHRELAMALFAALWAGILTDATGNLPLGTTSFSLLILGLVVILFREEVEEYSPYSAIVPAACLYPMLCVIQVISLRITYGGEMGPPFWLSVNSILRNLPFEIVLAVLIDSFLYRTEIVAANIKPKSKIIEI